MIILLVVVLHGVVAWGSNGLATFPIAVVNSIVGVWSIGIVANYRHDADSPPIPTLVAFATVVISFGLGVYSVAVTA